MQIQVSVAVKGYTKSVVADNFNACNEFAQTNIVKENQAMLPDLKSAQTKNRSVGNRKPGQIWSL